MVQRERAHYFTTTAPPAPLLLQTCSGCAGAQLTPAPASQRCVSLSISAFSDLTPAAGTQPWQVGVCRAQHSNSEHFNSV